MKTIRQTGNLSLNYNESQRLYNVSDDMLMKLNTLAGVSNWLNRDDVNDLNLINCSNEDFIKKVNELIGETI